MHPSPEGPENPEPQSLQTHTSLDVVQSVVRPGLKSPDDFLLLQVEGLRVTVFKGFDYFVPWLSGPFNGLTTLQLRRSF